MRIKSELELLDEKKRAEIIDEIRGPENQARKNEAYRRYRVYRDKTSAYVRELLVQQFDADTVAQMSYAVANVSLVRKVIDKLARVYANGTQREVKINDSLSQPASEAISDLAKALDFDSQMKKTNRFLKLQKNCAFYVKPCPVAPPASGGPEQWTLELLPMNPYLYDVVEDYYRRTEPMAYVLSHYTPRSMGYSQVDAAIEGRTAFTVLPRPVAGDGKDQKIADSPSDQGASGEDSKDSERFIWWSGSYHFTTNGKGEIVDSPSIENPIRMLPIVNFAIDQDGAFWAEGGDDLIDGAILINSMLTHLNHVAVSQGYGQFWMSGKKLPRGIKVGPTKAILMEYEEGEAKPELGFASASPQLDSMRSLVEMYVALLLTTNNLSTTGVSTQLQGGTSAASGIALMIDKAESREDVQDQEQIFRDKEPRIWKIALEWVRTYGAQMVEELQVESLPPPDAEVQTQFNPPQVIMTETERLDVLQKRRDLGIDSMVDTIMKDNPGMSREDAEAKLLLILEEKIKIMAASMALNPAGEEAEEGSPAPAGQSQKPPGAPATPEPSPDEPEDEEDA